MGNRLSKDAILEEMLAVLVDGWGAGAVHQALTELESRPRGKRQSGAKSRGSTRKTAGAVALIERSHAPSRNRDLLLRFAADFDAQRALPKLADIRSFLSSHNISSRGLKDRGQAFQRILPILEKMSEKGLLRVMSRAHHSGPAELDDISDAIKGSGETRRGDAFED